MNVVAEPLLVALLLSANVLDQRERPVAAKCVMAYAILVTEVAILALVPWVWRAIRARDRRAIAGLTATLVPYAGWCVWLRWRVGEFPFLAHAESRSGALGLPFAGIQDVVAARAPDYQLTVAMVLVTALLGACAAWIARRNPLGALAGLFAALALCLGPSALRPQGETIRVLVVPQVFALLALASALGSRSTFVTLHRARTPSGSGVA